MSHETQTQARVEQAQEREGQLRRLREEKAVADVFASSLVQFKVSPEQVLQSLGTVTFEDGLPLNAGKPLTERLRDYAAINPQAVASTIAETHDRGASTVHSKADLKDVAAKSAYIAAHGEMAFARLPLTAPDAVTDDTLTWAQYQKLPVREKVRLVNEKGKGFAATLQREAQEQQRYNKLIGVPAGRSA